MHQRPFPKPLPVKPLPQEVWLERTDRAEVGREAFFHGRDAEYDIFRKAVDSLREGQVGGGTMVFQGAPGIGKTALMQECMEAVRCHSTPDDPWVAVSIKPDTLESPAEVVMDLIDAANKESDRLSKMAPDAIARNLRKLLDLGGKLYGELSEWEVGVTGNSVSGRSQTASLSEMTVRSARIFREASPLLEKFHLVVFVDEAQNTPEAGTTKGVMGCLQDPPKEIPLVAAFFGLSDTEQVLRQCGLSRYAAKRVVNLNPLETRVAAGSFRRMFDAYYTGSEEEKDFWADALAKLSQGWPQHINQVGVAAGEVLRTNEGRLERHLLEQALDEGVERKNDYYSGRLAAGSNPPWVYKQLALKAADKQGELAGVLSYEEVIRLTESSRKTTDQTIVEFLTNALHAGLLAPVNKLPFHYRFPIPSLGDYLRALPVEPPQVNLSSV